MFFHGMKLLKMFLDFTPWLMRMRQVDSSTAEKTCPRHLCEHVDK